MKITKRVLVALTVLAFAGCASVSGLREQSPDLDLASNKDPTTVGQCVAHGWGEFMGVTINQGPTPSGGYTVSMPNGYTGNNGIFDASPVNTGSHVSVRYRLSGLGGYGKFTKVVKECV